MERVPFLDQNGISKASTFFSGRGKEWHESKRRFCSTYTAVAVLASILVIFLLRHSAVPRDDAPSGDGEALGVFNSTLGFGAIVLMSLKERTDRRDSVSLIAARSGIKITEFIEATHPEDIHIKARPYGKANNTVKDGYIGSWRTHMDALKYVVDHRLETALLFEDDVDWDVRIKSQLQTFSAGLQSNTLRNQSSTPISVQYPYGMDWDIMHLGAVIIKPAPRPYDKLWHPYVDNESPSDPGCWSKDPKNPMFCWSRLMETLGVPDNSRAIIPSHSITGLPAVAVTYEGAQRILWELSLNRLDYTLDWSIYNLLEKGRIKGWTVLPPLFGMWKIGGPADSDLLSFGKSSHAQISGHSPGIERSARQALTDQFTPAQNIWTNDYWLDLGVRIDFASIPPEPPEADAQPAA